MASGSVQGLGSRDHTFCARCGEMALAHSVGDRTEAAYRRGDLFEAPTAHGKHGGMFCTARRSPGNRRHRTTESTPRRLLAMQWVKRDAMGETPRLGYPDSKEDAVQIILAAVKLEPAQEPPFRNWLAKDRHLVSGRAGAPRNRSDAKTDRHKAGQSQTVHGMDDVLRHPQVEHYFSTLILSGTRRADY